MGHAKFTPCESSSVVCAGKDKIFITSMVGSVWWWHSKVCVCVCVCVCVRAFVYFLRLEISITIPVAHDAADATRCSRRERRCTCKVTQLIRPVMDSLL